MTRVRHLANDDFILASDPFTVLTGATRALYPKVGLAVVLSPVVQAVGASGHRLSAQCSLGGSVSSVFFDFFHSINLVIIITHTHTQLHSELGTNHSIIHILKTAQN